MTKFDKLNELVQAWINSDYETCHYSHNEMHNYASSILPHGVTVSYGFCRPGRLDLYHRRNDYLGRPCYVEVFATPRGVDVGRDPLSGKVNPRIAEQLQVLYDQV